MKAIVFVVAGALLTGFTFKKPDTLDGIWTGIYRSDNQREKVLVKFESQNQVELYDGEVIDSNKFMGTYKLQGDTVLTFSYKTASGKEYTMQGHINERKNYVDGVWKTSDKRSGSFYLKKEKIQEMFVAP
jgi:hypothetical protein